MEEWEIVGSEGCRECDVEDLEVMCKNANFRLMSLNAQSLNEMKKERVKLLMKDTETEMDVLCFQEVWGTNNVTGIEGYHKPIAKTRDSEEKPNANCGGGVAIYVKGNIKRFEQVNPRGGFVKGIYESAWVDLTTKSGIKKIIGSVYRPPGGRKEQIEQAVTIHEEMLQKMRKKYKGHQLMVVGDFNLDMLRLLEGEQGREEEVMHAASVMETRRLLEISTKENIISTVTIPTRETSRGETLIDYIFVDTMAIAKSLETRTLVVPSHISDHHSLVYLENQPGGKSKAKKIRRRIQNEKTIAKLGEEIRSREVHEKIPDLIQNKEEAEECFRTVLKEISEAMDKALPEKEVNENLGKLRDRGSTARGKELGKVLRKLSIEIRELRRKKKNWKSNGQLQEEVDLIEKIKEKEITKKSTVKQLKKEILEEMRKKLETELEAAKDSSKTTWKVLKNRAKYKNSATSSPPDRMIRDNKEGEAVGSKQVAEELNRFYVEIGPKLEEKIRWTGKNPKEFMGKNETCEFKIKDVSVKEIEEILGKIKPKTSSGPDGVSTKVLRTLKREFAPIIAKLVNISTRTATFPKNLKLARVQPLYKGEGKKNEATNYRPISLLSCIGKIIEKVVARQLMNYLEEEGLLNNRQYGFRANRNVTQPILEIAQKIFKHINSRENRYVLMVLIDLKKAFDTIQHNLLLEKLKHYGIKGWALKWFEEYLSDREQYTEINGEKSGNRRMVCGVPQGSVLGPILFLIFINDLPNAMKILTVLFADDTAMVKEGTDMEELARQLEQELETATEWFRANKLSLNVKKTKLIGINNLRKQSNNVPQIEPTVKMDGEKLQQVGEKYEEKSTRYLGVMLDDCLGWKYQVEKVIGKVKAATHAIRRIRTAPRKLKKMLYQALVESHLRFAVQVWGGVDQKYRGKLEAAQNSAVRAVSGMRKGHAEPSYAELQILKLKDLIGMESLKFMRQIRTNDEKCPKNLSDMDQGQSRNKEYSTPRLAHGFLRSWPSYSLPMHADRILKGGKEKTMSEIKARILASYSLIPENCKGTKCHCMREEARV